MSLDKLNENFELPSLEPDNGVEQSFEVANKMDIDKSANAFMAGLTSNTIPYYKMNHPSVTPEKISGNFFGGSPENDLTKAYFANTKYINLINDVMGQSPKSVNDIEADKFMKGLNKGLITSGAYTNKTVEYGDLNYNKRYAFSVEGVNMEDLYDKNQSGFASFGKGILNLGFDIAMNIPHMASFIGALAGFGNTKDEWRDVANSGFSAHILGAIDNSFGRTFSEFQHTWKEEWLPVYNSTKDTESGFMKRMFTDLEFWTSDAEEGIAFLIAAIAPVKGMQFLKIGERLTSGLSKSTRFLSKGIEKIGLAGLRESEAILTPLTGSSKASQFFMKTVNKFAITNEAKFARNLNVGLSTLYNTVTEAFFEGKDAMDAYMNSDDPRLAHLSIEERKKEAAKIAMSVAGMNMLVLSVSNLWEANLFTKKLPSSSSKFSSRFTNPNGSILGSVESRKVSIWEKAFNVGKVAVTGIGTEGYWEENMQLAATRFFTELYTPKSEEEALNNAFNTNPGFFSGMVHFFDVLGQAKNQAVSAFKGEDKEAAMNIGLGAILGGGAGALRTTLTQLKDNARLKKQEGIMNTYSQYLLKFGNIYETEVVKKTNEKVEEEEIEQLKLVDGKPVKDYTKMAAVVKELATIFELKELSNEIEKSNSQERLDVLYQTTKDQIAQRMMKSYFDLGAADVLFQKFSLENSKYDEADFTFLGIESKSNDEIREKFAYYLDMAKTLQKRYDASIKSVMAGRFSDPITKSNNKKRIEEEQKIRDLIFFTEGNRYTIDKLIEKYKGSLPTDFSSELELLLLRRDRLKNFVEQEDNRERIFGPRSKAMQYYYDQALEEMAVVKSELEDLFEKNGIEEGKKWSERLEDFLYEDLFDAILSPFNFFNKRVDNANKTSEEIKREKEEKKREKRQKKVSEIFELPEAVKEKLAERRRKEAALSATERAELRRARVKLAEMLNIKASLNDRLSKLTSPIGRYYYSEFTSELEATQKDKEIKGRPRLTKDSKAKDYTSFETSNLKTYELRTKFDEIDMLEESEKVLEEFEEINTVERLNEYYEAILKLAPILSEREYQVHKNKYDEAKDRLDPLTVIKNEYSRVLNEIRDVLEKSGDPNAAMGIQEIDDELNNLYRATSVSHIEALSLLEYLVPQNLLDELDNIVNKVIEPIQELELTKFKDYNVELTDEIKYKIAETFVEPGESIVSNFKGAGDTVFNTEEELKEVEQEIETLENFLRIFKEREDDILSSSEFKGFEKRVETLIEELKKIAEQVKKRIGDKKAENYKSQISVLTNALNAIGIDRDGYKKNSRFKEIYDSLEGKFKDIVDEALKIIETPETGETEELPLILNKIASAKILSELYSFDNLTNLNNTTDLLEDKLNTIKNRASEILDELKIPKGINTLSDLYYSLIVYFEQLNIGKKEDNNLLVNSQFILKFINSLNIEELIKTLKSGEILFNSSELSQSENERLKKLLNYYFTNELKEKLVEYLTLINDYKSAESLLEVLNGTYSLINQIAKETEIAELESQEAAKNGTIAFVPSEQQNSTIREFVQFFKSDYHKDRVAYLKAPPGAGKTQIFTNWVLKVLGIKSDEVLTGGPTVLSSQAILNSTKSSLGANTVDVIIDKLKNKKDLSDVKLILIDEIGRVESDKILDLYKYLREYNDSVTLDKKVTLLLLGDPNQINKDGSSYSFSSPLENLARDKKLLFLKVLPPLTIRFRSNVRGINVLSSKFEGKSTDVIGKETFELESNVPQTGTTLEYDKERDLLGIVGTNSFENDLERLLKSRQLGTGGDNKSRVIITDPDRVDYYKDFLTKIGISTTEIEVLSFEDAQGITRDEVYIDIKTSGRNKIINSMYNMSISRARNFVLISGLKFTNKFNTTIATDTKEEANKLLEAAVNYLEHRKGEKETISKLIPDSISEELVKRDGRGSSSVPPASGGSAPAGGGGGPASGGGGTTGPVSPGDGSEGSGAGDETSSEPEEKEKKDTDDTDDTDTDDTEDTNTQRDDGDVGEDIFDLEVDDVTDRIEDNTDYRDGTVDPRYTKNRWEKVKPYIETARSIFEKVKGLVKRGFKHPQNSTLRSQVASGEDFLYPTEEIIFVASIDKHSNPMITALVPSEWEHRGNLTNGTRVNLGKLLGRKNNYKLVGIFSKEDVENLKNTDKKLYDKLQELINNKSLRSIPVLEDKVKNNKEFTLIPSDILGTRILSDAINFGPRFFPSDTQRKPLSKGFPEIADIITNSLLKEGQELNGTKITKDEAQDFAKQINSEVKSKARVVIYTNKEIKDNPILLGREAGIPYLVFPEGIQITRKGKPIKLIPAEFSFQLDPVVLNKEIHDYLFEPLKDFFAFKKVIEEFLTNNLRNEKGELFSDMKKRETATSKIFGFVTKNQNPVSLGKSAINQLTYKLHRKYVIAKRNGTTLDEFLNQVHEFQLINEGKSDINNLGVIKTRNKFLTKEYHASKFVLDFKSIKNKEQLKLMLNTMGAIHQLVEYDGISDQSEINVNQSIIGDFSKNKDLEFAFEFKKTTDSVKEDDKDKEVVSPEGFVLLTDKLIDNYKKDGFEVKVFDKSGNPITTGTYPDDARYFLVKKVPASDEAEVHRLRSVYNFHFIATKRPDFESATSDQLAEFRIIRVNKGVTFGTALFEAMAKDKLFDNRYKMDYSRPLTRDIKNGAATKALNMLMKGNPKLFKHFGITNVEYEVNDDDKRKNKRTGEDRFRFVRVSKLLPLVNDSFPPKKVEEDKDGNKFYEQSFDLDDLERVFLDDSNWDESGNFNIIPMKIEGEDKNVRMRLQLEMRAKPFTQTIEGEVLTEDGKATRVSYHFPEMNFRSDRTGSSMDEFPIEFSLTHNVSSIERTSVEWIADKEVDELVSEYNKAKEQEKKESKEETSTEPTEEIEAKKADIEISDQEYNDFIDKGIVAQNRIFNIAEKIKNNEQLSQKELEIFNDKTSEINNRLTELKALENQSSTKEELTDEQVEKFFEDNPDIANEIYEELGFNKTSKLNIEERNRILEENSYRIPIKEEYFEGTNQNTGEKERFKLVTYKDNHTSLFAVDENNKNLGKIADYNEGVPVSKIFEFVDDAKLINSIHQGVGRNMQEKILSKYESKTNITSEQKKQAIEHYKNKQKNGEPTNTTDSPIAELSTEGEQNNLGEHIEAIEHKAETAREEEEIDEALEEVENLLEESGVSTRVKTVKITDIKKRPDIFQYKAVDGNTEAGTNKNETIQDAYSENRAGTLLVWEDKNNEIGGGKGAIYLVDGHHRMELMNRSGVKTANIFFIDAPNAKGARVEAAKVNIAQGRGTSIDAAKILREASEEEIGDFKPASKVGKEGKELAKLNNEIFTLVSNGSLSIEKGIAIAQVPQDKQEAFYKAIKRIEASGAVKMTKEGLMVMAEKINENNVATIKKVENTLFGVEESEELLLAEQSQLEADIKSVLSSDARILSHANKNKDVLEAAGNIVNTEENKKLSEDSKLASAVYDTFKKYSSIQSILKEATEQLSKTTDKKKKSAIRKKAIEDVKLAINREIQNFKGSETVTPELGSDIASSIEIDTAKEKLEKAEIPEELKQAIQKGYQVFSKNGTSTAKGGMIIQEFEKKGKKVIFKPEGDTSIPGDNVVIVFGSEKSGIIRHKLNGKVEEINSNNIIQDLFELYSSLSKEAVKEKNIIDDIFDDLYEDIGTVRDVKLGELKNAVEMWVDYFNDKGENGIEIMKNYFNAIQFNLDKIDETFVFLNGTSVRIENKIRNIIDKNFDTQEFYRSDKIRERFEEDIQMSFEEVYQELKRKIPSLTREQLRDRIVFISETDWLRRNLSSTSWGFVRNGVMYLRAGEKDSVNRIAVLHEMGHIIYDEFLTSKEKEIIREEYKNQFKTKGEEIEVQEWFADVLALSVDEKVKVSLGQRIVNLINKILNLLGFIRDNNRNLNDILTSFNNGVIGSRRVSQEERANKIIKTLLQNNLIKENCS